MTIPSSIDRILRPERMDQPGLDTVDHECALTGLKRLNVASRVCQQIWREIQSIFPVRAGQRMRILDVASGGGDVTLGLWKAASRSGVQLEIKGLDSSAVACAYAARHCREAGNSITFESANVLSVNLPTGFDVVISTLFLHHLLVNDAATLLAKMSEAGKVLIVSDLLRSRVGYVVAHAACHLLSRSRMVHHDGPQSVANAFTLDEMRALCQSAGLRSAIVRSAWPWRQMVVYRGS